MTIYDAKDYCRLRQAVTCSNRHIHTDKSKRSLVKLTAWMLSNNKRVQLEVAYYRPQIASGVYKEILPGTDAGIDVDCPALYEQDHVLSQNITELAKSSGLNGIIDRNMFGDGCNLALFDAINARPISDKLYGLH